MIIRYKSIVHERTEDAPFVGALVCAISCNIGCKGCFNKHLKKAEVLLDTAKGILDKVQANPFNEGLVLSGLEWSMQPKELIALIKEAQVRKIPVIVYTGYSADEFLYRVPEFKNFHGMLYLKHGGYDDNNLINDYYQYDIKLASSNQKVELVDDLLQHIYSHVIWSKMLNVEEDVGLFF